MNIGSSDGSNDERKVRKPLLAIALHVQGYRNRIMDADTQKYNGLFAVARGES